MCKLIIYKDHHTIHWGYISIDTHKQLSEFSKFFRKFKITFITLDFINGYERQDFINDRWRNK